MKIFPILLESDFNANSWLGLIISRWFYIDFSIGQNLRNIEFQIKKLLKPSVEATQQDIR